MSFTPSQQGVYRPLVDRAWLAHCKATGIAPNNKPARADWYRCELLAAAGVYTTKECDHIKDFDLVMLHFAILAGDEFWMARIAEADERRMRKVIRDTLFCISEQTGTHHDWAYAVATYRQMNLPLTIEDCPAKLLWKVLQALDTYRRRLDDKAQAIPPDRHHRGDHSARQGILPFQPNEEPVPF